MTERAEPESVVPVQDPEGTASAVAAATVVVVRGGVDALEVLLLQRHRDLSFAGGAWVFPGGRVDPADFGTDPAGLEGAERTAAVRECMEEAGIRLDLPSLHRWSHWTPPPRQSKRFSTAFFVAGVGPGDDEVVTIDESEIVAHRWATPQQALAAQTAGELVLTPPTFITLCQLAEHRSVAGLLAAAPSRPVEHFSTRIGIAGETVCALYHGDVAYESLDLSADGARHRLWMAPGPWRYERDA
jgi:8-oxo-dGTP pyrophosphatase MutT (NUDIX family)